MDGTDNRRTKSLVELKPIEAKRSQKRSKHGWSDDTVKSRGIE